MVDVTVEPKRLDTPEWRLMARRMRDHQWEIADRVLEHDPLWICWWNKNRHFDETKPLPADLLVCGLITGLELLAWFKNHADWWDIGEWSAERYAAPVRLTAVGRATLAEREKYDMEDVTGGLVEPGWIATPAEREAPLSR